MRTRSLETFRVRCSFIALVTALVSASPGVRADTERDREEARARFDRGLRLFDQGDNGGALAEFERAYQLVPHPAVLLNIGLTHAAAGDAVRALEALDRLLAPGASGPALSPADAARARAMRDEQAQRIGEVTVSANVPGTVIEMDGVEVGRTPLAAPIRVSGGSHVVGAIAPGYVPSRKPVSVAGRAQASVAFELVAAEGKLAAIVVRVDPVGAEVLVDEALVGESPLPASLVLAPGEHVIAARRSGYRTERRTVALGGGASGEVAFELAEDAAAIAREGGSVALAISEPDSVVYVDGKPRGAYSGPIRLAPGPHRLRVERAEFFPYERDVAIDRGRVTDLVVELEPTAEKRVSYRGSARTQQTWGHVVTWSGVGVLAASGGFLIWNIGNKSEKQAAFDDIDDAISKPGMRCSEANGNKTDACLEELDLALSSLESARDLDVLGIIGVGVGAAALGTGLTLILTGDDPDRYEPKPESDVFGRLRPRPVAVATPEVAWAGIAGAF